MRESMSVKNLSFFWVMSWRMLWRDWRSGELTILAIGLIIAVTSITAVGFFTDRIDRGLQQQSAELIGADLVITSSRPTVMNHSEQVRNANFDLASTQQFRSVVLAAGRPQLVEVKAVSNGYPLRGVLKVSDTAFATDVAITTIPARGEVWVEAALLQKLGIDPGQKINLGNSSFLVRKILRYEPDRAGDMFSVAPRLLMNLADLDATGLIATGSLVKYRLLIAGQRDRIDTFARLIRQQLKPGEQLLTVDEGRPELNIALARARQFLGLAALISVLLAGVAVATVAHRFMQRHLDTSAMLRCLGTSQQVIISLFSLEMLWLSLLASSVGCLLGGVTQLVITALLDQLVLVQLPAPSFKAVMLGYMTGIVMLIGFALPPLLALKKVPPLRVLRKDVVSHSLHGWLVYFGVVACMTILLYWQIGDLILVFTVLGGIMATVVGLALAAYILIKVLNSFRGRVGVAWRFGLANIARRPVGSVIQIVAFGIGIMVMLLLSTVRADLLADWQRSLPADAPNHFVINVQPDQVEGIQEYFTRIGVANTRLYPMVRARLVEINGKPVHTEDYQSERAKHMITREFNLSWSEKMQDDNQLVAGSWWTEKEFGQPLLSLEGKLAKTLGLKLNDQIGFDINGQVTTYTISNFRKVEWDSFNINFFTVVPPGVLEREPANWVTSVFLNGSQRQQLAGLVEQYPNITLVDVDNIMQRVRGIMNRVAQAIEFIFLFTILAGLAVLYAAIQANQDERRFENAVLRTLGAKKQVLLLGLITEFTMLGALSGLLAGVAASAIAWLLAEVVFKFDYQFDSSVALLGVVSGAVIVAIAGLLGTRSVLMHPPIQTLREGSA